ncbi:MAG: hypothetical protein E6J85_15415 [Deltaproteobacteria bacterium]|nr:MAG: hypothetical protein E6J85_15415 [Deltaproteobacteria bacterium]
MGVLAARRGAGRRGHAQRPRSRLVDGMDRLPELPAGALPRSAGAGRHRREHHRPALPGSRRGGAGDGGPRARAKAHHGRHARRARVEPSRASRGGAVGASLIPRSRAAAARRPAGIAAGGGFAGDDGRRSERHPGQRAPSHADFRWQVGELPQFSSLTPRSVLAIQRIVLEALTNSLRHAGARLVTVTTRLDGSWLQIGVADDGVGFDQASIVPGRGLESLRQRAHGLGGTVEIRSSRGAGTSVTLRLPFEGARRP